MATVQFSKGNITPHFTISEVFVHQTSVIKLTPKQYADILAHANRLERFRVKVNEVMPVNAWYRTQDYNAKVGGTKNSGHLSGKATDCGNSLKDQIKVHNWWNIWQNICKEDNVVACMGWYPDKKFIHLESAPDWTKRNTFWKEENGKLRYMNI